MKDRAVLLVEVYIENHSKSIRCHSPYQLGEEVHTCTDPQQQFVFKPAL